jgi:hypothetical protein
MIDGEYVLQAGKFLGCRPSDIPAEDLRHEALRGSITALDRLALQDHVRGIRRNRAHRRTAAQAGSFPLLRRLARCGAHVCVNGGVSIGAGKGANAGERR